MRFDTTTLFKTADHLTPALEEMLGGKFKVECLSRMPNDDGIDLCFTIEMTSKKLMSHGPQDFINQFQAMIKDAFTNNQIVGNKFSELTKKISTLEEVISTLQLKLESLSKYKDYYDLAKEMNSASNPVRQAQ